MHRLWKRFAVQMSGVREGGRVLDVAGGTGDLSALFAARVGVTGQVWLTDINGAMLARGRDRLLDRGRVVPVVQCDAERLPFRAIISIARWWARVAQHDAQRDRAGGNAARAAHRRKPAGAGVSRRCGSRSSRCTTATRSRCWPLLGKLVADDADSYRYLRRVDSPPSRAGRTEGG